MRCKRVSWYTKIAIFCSVRLDAFPKSSIGLVNRRDSSHSFAKYSSAFPVRAQVVMQQPKPSLQTTVTCHHLVLGNVRAHRDNQVRLQGGTVFQELQLSDCI